MSKRKKYGGEPHVRLYRHELECEAYRSLSTDARALLVELRSLYNYREAHNRVFLSVRDMMRRLNVGDRRARHARDELLDRGFIRLVTPGSFTQKSRQASEYALTNEAPDNKPGSVASKDFMRWTKKTTVVMATTDSSQNNYRESAETPAKSPHGSQDNYRQGQKRPAHGSQNDYTDKLPGQGVDEWLDEHLGAPCRNGQLLNTNCIVCRVWITEDGFEFDGGRHTCDSSSKAAYEKRLRTRSEPKAA